jgi:hypothetical protein
MSEALLFHAYVIGGTRESAREYIRTMLAEFGVGADEHSASEHISFGIDDARALRASGDLMLEAGKRRIYIVYADFMTPQAENALLKTLEEPAANTHIIIAIPKPEVLLPTLLSRVRVIMPNAKAGTGLEAKKFLILGRGERLAHIAKLVEKGDEDEAAAEVREKALSLMDSLELLLSLDMQKNATKLELILKFKKYLYIPGASSRMILETLAVSL